MKKSVFDTHLYMTKITNLDLQSHGYRHFQSSDIDHEMCIGHFQKRFDDEFGKKYFIDFNVTDMSSLESHPYVIQGKPLTLDASGQFTKDKLTFDINVIIHTNNTLDEVEALFEEIFQKLECDDYENFFGSKEETKKRREETKESTIKP